jgi:hypothetical protein
MPATPIVAFYKKVLFFGLAATSIAFAPTAAIGHRVVIEVPLSQLNKLFYWTRAAGESAPTGRFRNTSEDATVNVRTLLVNAFGTPYDDIDAVAGGLDFSSSTLDMPQDLKRNQAVYNIATDTGLAAGGAATSISTTSIGANDLVMSFVLFKCFGSSAYDPTDIIYNIDDAFNMLTSMELAMLIENSLVAEDGVANALVQPNGPSAATQDPEADKGFVNELFQMFLAKNPARYTTGGQPTPGLFSNTYTGDVSGNWNLMVGDKIEFPVQLVFRAPVSVTLDTSTSSTATTEVLPGEVANYTYAPGSEPAAENTIPIRLQFVCVDDSASTSGEATGEEAKTGE